MTIMISTAVILQRRISYEYDRSSGRGRQMTVGLSMTAIFGDLFSAGNNPDS